MGRLIVFVGLIVIVVGGVKVGLLQMQNTNSPTDNMNKALQSIKDAKSKGVDIVSTPGRWVSESNISAFTDLAKSSSIAIALGFVPNGPPPDQSSQLSGAVVIDSQGKILKKYVKVEQLDSTGAVIPAGGGEDAIRPITLTVPSENKDILVGLLISHDREFPEVSRMLMLGGTHLVFVLNTGNIGQIHLHQMEARSFEDAFVICLVNDVNSESSNGQTCAYDWNANIYVQTDDKTETDLIFDFKLDDLVAYRFDKTIYGDTFRRPFHYQKLCGIDNNAGPPPPLPADDAPEDFVVAVLQMMCDTKNIDGNRDIAEKMCRQAKSLGADVALFPEMFSVGYDTFCPDYDDSNPAPSFEWTRHSTPLNGDYVKFFQDLAQELDMAIGATFMQSLVWGYEAHLSGDQVYPFYMPPRNGLAMIDRHGNIVYNYAKVHTCVFGGDEILTTPGSYWYTGMLDIGRGNVSIGSMICYDREQPESARQLMLGGAEVLLIPNACGFSTRLTDQLSARAFENAVGLAMANYPAPKYNGKSQAWDHLGNNLLLADDKEGVYLAHFNVKAIRQYRAQKDSKGGWTYTQPQRFTELCNLRRISDIYSGQNYFGRTSGGVL